MIESTLSRLSVSVQPICYHWTHTSQTSEYYDYIKKLQSAETRISLFIVIVPINDMLVCPDLKSFGKVVMDDLTD